MFDDYSSQTNIITATDDDIITPKITIPNELNDEHIVETKPIVTAEPVITQQPVITQESVVETPVEEPSSRQEHPMVEEPSFRQEPTYANIQKPTINVDVDSVVVDNHDNDNNEDFFDDFFGDEDE